MLVFSIFGSTICVHVYNKSTCPTHEQKELHPDKFVNCRGYLTLDGHVVSAVAAISYTFDALLETLEL